MSEFLQNYPDHLTPYDVIIKYELVEEEEEKEEKEEVSGPAGPVEDDDSAAADAATADADTDTTIELRYEHDKQHANIKHEERTIQITLQLDHEYDMFHYNQMIHFARPVKFKSARILYAWFEVACLFSERSTRFVNTVAELHPGSPVVFAGEDEDEDGDGGSSNSDKHPIVHSIFCTSPPERIYSEL